MTFFTDNPVVELQPVPLQDILWRDSFISELINLGLEKSTDLWLFGIFSMGIARPYLANLLDRVCDDFRCRWPHLGSYDWQCRNSRIIVGSSTPNPHKSSDVTDDSTLTVIVEMRFPSEELLVWEARLPESIVNNEFMLDTEISDHEICRFLLAEAQKDDLKPRHYIQGKARSWDKILPPLTLEFFKVWLNNLKWTQGKNLGVLEERLGLKSGCSMTLEEVGRHHQLTRERARQIVVRSIKELTHHKRLESISWFGSYVAQLFERNGGVMTTKEVYNHFPSPINVAGYSPLPAIGLLLFCCGKFSALDYNFIKQSGRKDISSVTWYLKGVEPDEILSARSSAITVLRNSPGHLLIEDLCKIISADTQISPKLVRASLRTYDNLSIDSEGSVTLSPSMGSMGKPTIPVMLLAVLREIGTPAHFTQIAKKQNEMFPERQLKPHHISSRLVENALFRWVDRGTYGLAEWGLPEIRPKEEYRRAKQQVVKALQAIDRPAHIKEINDYLVKDREESGEEALISETYVILIDNPNIFTSLGHNKWALAEWNVKPQLAKDTVGMVCIILSDEETTWLTFQQLFTAMKSRGWPSGYYSVKSALDREISKKERRIRKEELHGFNIHLYGLSSQVWNEVEVLQKFLAD